MEKCIRGIFFSFKMFQISFLLLLLFSHFVRQSRLQNAIILGQENNCIPLQFLWKKNIIDNQMLREKKVVSRSFLETESCTYLHTPH